jgi:pimeloyl-ACP methyl ester carboxylesterase
MTGEGYADFFVSAGDGLRLFAREYRPRHGDALPVVCLPGLARTSADFHDLALALSQDTTHPRRVLCVDYRGRGRSAYDPNWRNYDIKIELDDVLQVLTVAGVDEAAFVGTSRGGLITMALSATRPALLRGAILNDIGPVIESKGLARIRGYVGKLPTPRDYREGGEVLKTVFAAQFPRWIEEDWERFARTTWKTVNGRLVLDYDVALSKILETVDLETPVAPLWPGFAGLKRVPVMVLRGANSDLLSAETLEAMTGMHPDLEAVTVPDQGHPVALRGRDMIQRLRRFILRVEEGSEARRSPARAGAP